MNWKKHLSLPACGFPEKGVEIRASLTKGVATSAETSPFHLPFLPASVEWAGSNEGSARHPQVVDTWQSP